MARLSFITTLAMWLVMASFMGKYEQKSISVEPDKIAMKDKRFIVKGEDAIPHEFPWTVYLHFTFKDNSTGSCTGTLISPRIVLTSAHCARKKNHTGKDPVDTKSVAVFPGWHKNPLEEKKRLDVDTLDLPHLTASKVMLPPLPKSHRDYRFYDYGVIILPKQLKKNKTVQFIPFADSMSPKIQDLICFAAGFGLDKPEHKKPLKNKSKVKRYLSLPNVLQKLLYKMPYPKQCYNLHNEKLIEAEKLSEAGSNQIAADLKRANGAMICGFSRRVSSGICSGDSGGPLMCRNRAGPWVLYGVTSKTIHCKQLSLFANVISISGWLKKMVAKYDPEYQLESQAVSSSHSTSPNSQGPATGEDEPNYELESSTVASSESTSPNLPGPAVDKKDTEPKPEPGTVSSIPSTSSNLVKSTTNTTIKESRTEGSEPTSTNLAGPAADGNDAESKPESGTGFSIPSTSSNLVKSTANTTMKESRGGKLNYKMPLDVKLKCGAPGDNGTLSGTECMGSASGGSGDQHRNLRKTYIYFLGCGVVVLFLL